MPDWLITLLVIVVPAIVSIVLNRINNASIIKKMNIERDRKLEDIKRESLRRILDELFDYHDYIVSCITWIDRIHGIRILDKLEEVSKNKKEAKFYDKIKKYSIEFDSDLHDRLFDFYSRNGELSRASTEISDLARTSKDISSLKSELYPVMLEIAVGTGQVEDEIKKEFKILTNSPDI